MASAAWTLLARACGRVIRIAMTSHRREWMQFAADGPTRRPVLPNKKPEAIDRPVVQTSRDSTYLPFGAFRRVVVYFRLLILRPQEQSSTHAVRNTSSSIHPSAAITNQLSPNATHSNESYDLCPCGRGVVCDFCIVRALGSSVSSSSSVGKPKDVSPAS